MKTTIPTVPIIDQFATLTSPLFKRIEMNIKESDTLTALRDALLPKLISGEIRVTYAEKLVERTI